MISMHVAIIVIDDVMPTSFLQFGNQISYTHTFL